MIRNKIVMASLLVGANMPLAQAEPVRICALLHDAAIESILGAKIAKKTEGKGYIFVNCMYRGVANEIGGSMINIVRWTVPATDWTQVMPMQPNASVTKLPGLGDEAVMLGTPHWELAIRRGSVWYTVTTRSIACPAKKPSESWNEQSARCDEIQKNALMRMAQEISKL